MIAALDKFAELDRIIYGPTIYYFTTGLYSINRLDGHIFTQVGVCQEVMGTQICLIFV